MRVLIDCRMATWSGIGRYTRGIVRGIDATGEVSLTLLSARGDAPVLSDSERATTVYAAASPLSLSGMHEFSSAVRDSEPDIVHCVHIPTPLSSSPPLVVTVHDLIPLLVRGVMPSPIRRFVFRMLVARAVGLAKLLLVPSRATETDLVQLFPKAKGKVTITAEAADDFVDRPHEPFPPNLLSPGTPYLLGMGNTKPHKDVPALLAAFHLLAPAHPELQLLLVGEQKPDYLDTWSPGTRDRVRFTGSVTDGQLRALYAGATVFAFPSRYEGFGLPPLEAMALGTPVVVADATSLPEVVGDAALRFEPGDPTALAAQIERLLSDSVLRDRMVAAGRMRAAELTWERTARVTLDAYREALHR